MGSGCGLSAGIRVKAHSVEQRKKVRSGNGVWPERAFSRYPEEPICPCLCFPPSLQCARMRPGNGVSEMCTEPLTFGFSELCMGSNVDDESGIGTSGRRPLAAN